MSPDPPNMFMFVITVFEADLVVLSAGSWTASAFPELSLQKACLATGQCVAMLQLTPEEADMYRDCPVFLNFHTGFYIFPPNQENVMKFAIHDCGYTQPVKSDKTDSLVSTPRTVLSHGSDGCASDGRRCTKLRSELAQVYPELAKKPIRGHAALLVYGLAGRELGDRILPKTTRTSFSQLLVAVMPTRSQQRILTLACAQFLPVLGRLVVDGIEGALPPDVANRFAVDRAHGPKDGTVEPEIRAHPPAQLVEDELCTPEDLLPAPAAVLAQ
ncbi:hypothetical protein NUW54_g11156 [Trametes sanguinea]|uniref:Uncharacterized protein n=1 Tax=Trametes sanguinea TaxID=158606 RepID=A0ACC1NJ21_9APHY|nr:hypothetical protein NUW54_g11156 [Trametes sanguinea]